MEHSRRRCLPRLPAAHHARLLLIAAAARENERLDEVVIAAVLPERGKGVQLLGVHKCPPPLPPNTAAPELPQPAASLACASAAVVTHSYRCMQLD
jgi:hypothetical protein